MKLNSSRWEKRLWAMGDEDQKVKEALIETEKSSHAVSSLSLARLLLQALVIIAYRPRSLIPAGRKK
jgi:hypothetical protein